MNKLISKPKHINVEINKLIPKRINTTINKLYLDKSFYYKLIKYKTIKILFIFQHKHDLEIYTKLINFIKTEIEILNISDASDFDCCVGIYLKPENCNKFDHFNKPIYLLAGEPNLVYKTNNIQFVQANINKEKIFHAPTLIIWSTPTSINKTKICSAIDSGKREWRKQKIIELSKNIPIDFYGKGFNKTIDGHHRDCPEKEIGIREYMFSIGIEHQIINDYITEKYNDIILNESIPIYRGPEVDNYFIPCHINIDAIDIKNINREFFNKNINNIIENKNRILSKYNVFSYFSLILYNNLLHNKRPIL